MVWLNGPQTVKSDEMTKRVDNPSERGVSFFDGAHWNAETRERLSIRLYARLEIPNTNKSDMKKFADLLHGLATQMEYLSANTALTEHGANMQFRNAVMMVNHELKNIGKIDLREQKNRGKQRQQNNRSDTTSR